MIDVALLSKYIRSEEQIGCYCTNPDLHTKICEK